MLMAQFVFFSNSIATSVPPPLFCSTSLTYSLNKFWAIHFELFFMPILRKCTKLQIIITIIIIIMIIKKIIIILITTIIIIIIIITIKNSEGMFFSEVSLQHPNLRKWNSTMSVFLGITAIIFWWVFQNSYYIWNPCK